jgi:hypothetical protein
MAAWAGENCQDRVAKSEILIFPEFLVEMQGFEPSTPRCKGKNTKRK